MFRRVREIWPGPFRIGFCAEREPGRTFDLDFAGLETEFLPGHQWRPVGQINPFSIKWNPWVTRSLESFDPQAVVLSGYVHPTMIRAARWCISRNVPYAITCETSAKSTRTSGLRWEVKRRAIGWMIRKMAFGLPVGHAAAEYMRTLGACQAPMHFFPNTPDTTLFRDTVAQVEAASSEAKIRRQLGLPENGPVFTFIGRMIGAKRPLDAIQAFRGLPLDAAAALIVVGDGDLLPIARTIAAQDPRIVFSGWISDVSEIARLLAISSALVLPSEHEPWGAVVNEAMASKSSVIATDRVGAALELIDDGVEGFIVPVGDVPAIRSAMTSLISDRARRIEMGKAAQAKAINFGADFAAGNLVSGFLTASQAH